MSLDFSFDQTFYDTFSQRFIAQSAHSYCLGYIPTVNWLYRTLLHSLYVGCSKCSKNLPPPRSRFVFTVIIYGCSGESDMEDLAKCSDDDILDLGNVSYDVILSQDG